MTDDLSFPASWKARPPRLADATPAAQDSLGRPLNPDTNLPYPSASAAQLDLVEELLGKVTTASMGDIRDLLTDAVVRQHGRTLRACLDDLRAQARANDEEAVKALDGAVYDDGRVNSGRVAAADTLARASLTLRATHLRADRA